MTFKLIISALLAVSLSVTSHAVVDRTVQAKKIKNGAGLHTVPSSGTSNLVGDNLTQTLTNKTLNASTNTISNISNANIAASAAVDRSKIAAGTINAVVINDGTGNFSGVVPGSNGNVLISNGTTWSSSTTPQGVGAYRSVTATDTATTSDNSLSLSGVSFTQNIYTAVGNTGRILDIVHNGTSLSDVYTLDGSAAETIGGSSTYPMYTNGERLRIVSNGANWIVLNHETLTGWASYTPTLGAGLGTVSSETAKWRRVGENIEVAAHWINGTVAASVASISLPGGMTIDGSKQSHANDTSNSGPLVGSWVHNTNANEAGSLITATTTSTALVYFGVSHSGVSKLVSQNGNAIMSSGDNVSARFEVPILGWSP